MVDHLKRKRNRTTLYIYTIIYSYVESYWSMITLVEKWFFK